MLPIRDITNIAPSASQGSIAKLPRPSLAFPPTAFSKEPPCLKVAFPEVRAAAGELTHRDELGREEGLGRDPQEVAEYTTSIYSTLMKTESRYRPQPDYMDAQVEINPKFRAILVDWLVDIQKRYKLKVETFFLAINLIDRYLACRSLPKKKLQLVGVTCVLIAAKFEEIYPPELKDLAYITDNTYTKDEIISMELTILSALEFNIVVPTAAVFFQRFHRVNKCSDVHRDLIQYVLELSLLDMRFLHYPPSHLVAAATYLTNKLVKPQQMPWAPRMVSCTNLTEDALKPCAKELCGVLSGASRQSLKAIRRKFSHERYNSVATMDILM